MTNSLVLGIQRASHSIPRTLLPCSSSVLRGVRHDSKTDSILHLLSIATNYLPRINPGQPIVPLFVVALFFNGRDEHVNVHHVRADIVAQICSHGMIFFAPTSLVEQSSELFATSKS